MFGSGVRIGSARNIIGFQPDWIRPALRPEIDESFAAAPIFVTIRIAIVTEPTRVILIHPTAPRPIAASVVCGPPEAHSNF